MHRSRRFWSSEFSLMLKLKPEILKKNGKKQFVVLTYEEYVRLRELLDDAEDQKSLRAAKARQAGAKRMPLAEMKRLLRRRPSPRT